MKHYVNVSGCDDSTSVVVELTAAQAAGVRIVAEAITAASEAVCMPTMTTRPATPADMEHVND